MKYNRGTSSLLSRIRSVICSGARGYNYVHSERQIDVERGKALSMKLGEYCLKGAGRAGGLSFTSVCLRYSEMPSQVACEFLVTQAITQTGALSMSWRLLVKETSYGVLSVCQSLENQSSIKKQLSISIYFIGVRCVGFLSCRYWTIRRGGRGGWGGAGRLVPVALHRHASLRNQHEY